MLPFSQCEEAFLLKNVQNVIDVWARGSGLAKLTFSARNGQAELQLFYQLGHPEASHLPHQPPSSAPNSNPPHPQSPPASRRQKSLKRKLKDRKRAAEFQARRKAEASSLASSSGQPTTTTTTRTTSTAVSSPGLSFPTTTQADSSFRVSTNPQAVTSTNLDVLIQMLPHLYDQPTSSSNTRQTVISSNLSTPTTS